LKQLNLNLQTAQNLSEENFLILEENSAAFHFLEKFFAQKDFSQSQFQSLILKGPKASGKTHLLNIFAKKSGAEFLQIKKNTNKKLVKNLKANHFYILENIDEIQNEELLLHLINSAVETKAFLILSSNQHQFKLKDLDSRLKNIFALQIKDPHLESIEMLLINAFSRRQIKVSSRIINFISDNISRSYEAILNAANLIESYCQDHGKNITLKNVSDILLRQK